MASEQGMARSSVVGDVDKGGSAVSDIRTSHGTFLARRKNKRIADIEARIASWTMLPEDHGEGLQVSCICPYMQSQPLMLCMRTRYCATRRIRSTAHTTTTSSMNPARRTIVLPLSFCTCRTSKKVVKLCSLTYQCQKVVLGNGLTVRNKALP